MAVLKWSKARYTCGPSKSNSNSNVIRSVIWILAFPLSMRELSIFIDEIGLVNVDVGEFSTSITKSIFLTKLGECFLPLFSQNALEILEDAGKCGGSNNISLKLGLGRRITTMLYPFLASEEESCTS